MVELRHSLLRVLKRYQDVKLCLVFGSTARGRSSSESDLDIAIAGEEPLPADKFLELSEEFSSETRCEIDLADLMTATGPILKQALSTGVVVQNCDKGLYARLILRMLFIHSVISNCAPNCLHDTLEA
jgi:predicted nucleotidyltransferase